VLALSAGRDAGTGAVRQARRARRRGARAEDTWRGPNPLQVAHDLVPPQQGWQQRHPRVDNGRRAVHDMGAARAAVARFWVLFTPAI
jgi:hypothetical protein